MATKFTDPTTMQMGKTLGRRLIAVADNIRDLYTRFGLRPYKLRVVRMRWSGGERGVGVATIDDAMDILPTPLVLDLSTLTEVVQPVGLDEVGTILVTEVSGRFTDDQLRFHGKHGEEVEPDVEVFYEIEFPPPDGPRSATSDSIKRRFYLRSAPHYNASKFQWQMRLERAHEDRDRNGDPR